MKSSRRARHRCPRVLLLEPVRQLRVGLGLREALRPVPRRLRDPAADPKGQRAL